MELVSTDGDTSSGSKTNGECISNAPTGPKEFGISFIAGYLFRVLVAVHQCFNVKNKCKANRQNVERRSIGFLFTI